MVWCNIFNLVILYYVITFIFFTTPVSVFRKSFFVDCYILWWCCCVRWNDNNWLIGWWWWCLIMSITCWICCHLLSVHPFPYIVCCIFLHLIIYCMAKQWNQYNSYYYSLSLSFPLCCCCWLLYMMVLVRTTKW